MGEIPGRTTTDINDETGGGVPWPTRVYAEDVAAMPSLFSANQPPPEDFEVDAGLEVHAADMPDGSNSPDPDQPVTLTQGALPMSMSKGTKVGRLSFPYR